MANEKIGFVFWIIFFILAFIFYVLKNSLDEIYFFNDKDKLFILNGVNYLLIIVLFVYNIITWIYSMKANIEMEKYEKGNLLDETARNEADKSQNKAKLLNNISLSVSIPYIIFIILGVIIISNKYEDELKKL